MNDLWPWLVLAGLGAFHGLNPAMGWLFAVALGLNRKSRSVVLLSLLPIAIGHALSILIVAGAFVTAGILFDQRAVQIGAGLLLIGWAAYHQFRGHKHRIRVGMRTGLMGLTLWSFLMATAHGAGLMLLPALMPLCLSGSPAREITAAGSAPIVLAAVAVHTLSMLAVTGAVAVSVYEWIGLAILRSTWINLDLLWAAALAVTGLLLVALA
ncbi:MAG TPA: hypothetical protein VF226_06965 [Hyphomicrobiaceae bacterium]|jgi:hypothetical protein